MLKISSGNDTEFLQKKFIETFVGWFADKRSKLILLSGGSVIELYRESITSLKNLDLSHITLGMVDERYGQVNHEDNNFYQIEKLGFWKLINDNGGSIISHKMGVGLLASADKYEEDLKNILQKAELTVGVFGIGVDGHTAGIIPFKDEVRFKDVFCKNNLVIGFEMYKEGNFPVVDNPYKQRITVSPYFIKNNIDEILVYAVGKNKKEVVAKMFENGEISQIPARVMVEKSGALLTDLEITNNKL